MNKKILKLFSVLVTATVILSLLIGCAPAAPATSVPQYPVHAAKTRFKIATTTSLYDTGLWYYLEPMFEKYADVEMDIIYAGTGIALEYGKRGDVDAVVVHDPAAEDKFIADGYGINRRYFAYNFFLIAGPPADPAGIKGLSATEAFKKIYEAGMSNPDSVKFISRGDNSGTHSKEKLIWSKAGFNYDDILNSGKWYEEAGKGMGPSLVMANEQQAYILADISTFLSYTKNTSNNATIVSLAEQDPVFLNVYAVMAINPDTTKVQNIDIANKFINWLISPEIQNVIGTYGKAEYGRSLFFPLSDGSCTMEGCPSSDKYSTPVP
jgi:tungstate transport system substrate-binding protein